MTQLMNWFCASAVASENDLTKRFIPKKALESVPTGLKLTSAIGAEKETHAFLIESSVPKTCWHMTAGNCAIGFVVLLPRHDKRMGQSTLPPPCTTFYVVWTTSFDQLMIFMHVTVQKNPDFKEWHCTMDSVFRLFEGVGVQVKHFCCHQENLLWEWGVLNFNTPLSGVSRGVLELRLRGVSANMPKFAPIDNVTSIWLDKNAMLSFKIAS